MADIFDTLDAPAAEPKGDIFDQVSAPPAGDIFDQVSSTPAAQAAPQSNILTPEEIWDSIISTTSPELAKQATDLGNFALATNFGPSSLIGATQIMDDSYRQDAQEAKNILAGVQKPRLDQQEMLRTARETGRPVLFKDGKATLGEIPGEPPLSGGDQLTQGIERGLGAATLRVGEGLARVTGLSGAADSLGVDLSKMDSVLPQQTGLGKFGSGLGGATALLSGGGLPGALGIAGTQAVASGYDQALRESKEMGNPEAVARQDAQVGAFKSAVKSVPELAAYWLLGAGAAKAAAPLLQQASPLVKGLVGGAAATAANVATSTALHAINNEPLFTPEGLAQDATFGFLAHGLGEGAKAVHDEALVREQLRSAPDEALKFAASDSTFRNTSPYDPRLIDQELASRNLPAGPGAGELALENARKATADTPPGTPISPDVIEGLVRARNNAIKHDAESSMIGEINKQLSAFDPEVVKAEEEKALLPKEPPPRTEGEAPPVTAGGPRSQGVRSPLFDKRATEGAAPTAEAPPAAAPEEPVAGSTPEISTSSPEYVKAAQTLGRFQGIAEAAAKASGATDEGLAVSEAIHGTETNPQGGLAARMTRGEISPSEAKAALVDASKKAALKQLDAEKAQKRGGGNVGSLDAENESGHSVANTVAAPEPAPESTEAVSAMHSAIDSVLSERDAKILRGQLDGKSMEAIGKEHGISKQAVSQIVEKSLPKIRAAMEKAGISKEDIAHEEAQDWTQATSDRGMLRKDFGEGGALGGKGGSSKGLKVFKDRKMSELDQATGARSAKLQRSFADAQKVTKEVRKVAPTEDAQGGISLWIEAGGNMTKLQAWEAGAKGDALRKAAKAAQSLTPEQINMARKVSATFDILEQRGNKYDVLGEHRDNYVPHVWDVGSKPIFGGGLKQNFKFNKARTFENFAEGDAAGFKPKTLEIGKLLPTYLEEMNRVIADRQFVEDISTLKAKDGRPLVAPRGRVSEITTDNEGKAYLANPDAIKGMKDKEGNPIDTTDYKVLNEPALHDWRWEGKDIEGNPIYMKDDLALHPEAVDRVKAMVGKSKVREWANQPREGIGPNLLPAAFRAVDTAQSVMKREMFSLLAPFHQVQEGTHAVAHLVNPFSGIPKIDLRDAAQEDAAKHGLMLLPDRTSAQQYLEGVGGRGGFISQAARFVGEKTPIVGKAATVLADTIDGYQNYLFHQYIPGLKFKTYNAILERNMGRYGPELSRGELTPSDVKLLTAEQTNAAYGHLNYAMLDRSPTVQHFLRLGLLAPDFLEARGRFVGQAVKGLTGSKVGAEQLKALATIAAIQAASAYTISSLSSGKYSLTGDPDKRSPWDPKDPFKIVVGNRKYGLRTVPADIAHLLNDPRQFTYGRVNPLTVKTGVQLGTGLNYRGEKTSALETAEEALAQYIPITARQIPGIRDLTETSKHTPVSPLEQLAGSLGVQVSRKSPITDTYKNAQQWMDSQKIARDTGSYPVSKYQQLRYALEDGDLDQAQKEYDTLKKDATAGKLQKGFLESTNHPFTQSKEMDKKFEDSLQAKGQEKEKSVLKLAQEKRAQIVDRFSRLH